MTIFPKKKVLRTFQSSADHNILMICTVPTGNIHLAQVSHLVFPHVIVKETFRRQAMQMCQKMDRIKPFKVHEFIAKDTVEENILKYM